MIVKEYFDQGSNTFTYLLVDNQTKEAVLIDPVLKFDPVFKKIHYDEINELISEVNKYNLKYILETHVHADHLTASHFLKNHFPKVKVCISDKIAKVQEIFTPILEIEMSQRGKEFDVLLKDNQILSFGNKEVLCLSTPGHTPACMSFLVDDRVYTGDALFMPDFGTGRCDFPGGSATDLYHSISHKLHSLPNNTKVFVGHDYGTVDRKVQNQTTIEESKNNNIQISNKVSEQEFINFRTKRDAELAPPKLLFQSLQVNLLAGKLPKSLDSGKIFFKIPVEEI